MSVHLLFHSVVFLTQNRQSLKLHIFFKKHCSNTYSCRGLFSG